MTDVGIPFPPPREEGDKTQLTCKAKVSSQQMRLIIDRLNGIIEEQIEEGRKAGVALTRDHIGLVLERAVRTARGEALDAPEPSSVESLYMNDLFEEINAQPRHIFDTARDDEGHEYLIPMRREIWVQCLEAFCIQW